MEGWIKIHRKILDNPIVCKDADHFAIWNYLLLCASHKNMNVLFNGKKIVLNSGQVITGRIKIAKFFNISESKVHRILKSLEIEQQIEQQTGNKNRLITIVKWHEYQDNTQESEQQNEQQLNNNRTTTEQQLNTNKNIRIKEYIKENIPLKGDTKEKEKSFSSPRSKKEILLSMLSESLLSESVKSTLQVWLEYKKYSYAEVGFKALLTVIGKRVDEFEEEPVCELITECMSNNWQGIIWDKITNKTKASQQKTESFQEKLRRITNERN